MVRKELIHECQCLIQCASSIVGNGARAYTVNSAVSLRGRTRTDALQGFGPGCHLGAGTIHTDEQAEGGAGRLLNSLIDMVLKGLKSFA